MSDLRGIIEAATEGFRTPIRGDDNGWFVQVPTEAGGYHHSVTLGLSYCDGEAIGELSEVDARFIATFDPEHVRLILAASEAAECYAEHARVSRYNDDALWGEYIKARDARDAYRKEHGYE